VPSGSHLVCSEHNLGRPAGNLFHPPTDVFGSGDSFCHSGENLTGLAQFFFYSRLRALTGSTLAARLAGHNPDTSDTSTAPSSNRTQNFMLNEKIVSGTSNASSGLVISRCT